MTSNALQNTTTSIIAVYVLFSYICLIHTRSWFVYCSLDVIRYFILRWLFANFKCLTARSDFCHKSLLHLAFTRVRWLQQKAFRGQRRRLSKHKIATVYHRFQRWYIWLHPQPCHCCRLNQTSATRVGYREKSLVLGSAAVDCHKATPPPVLLAALFSCLPFYLCLDWFLASLLGKYFLSRQNAQNPLFVTFIQKLCGIKSQYIKKMK